MTASRDKLIIATLLASVTMLDSNVNALLFRGMDMNIALHSPRGLIS